MKQKLLSDEQITEIKSKYITGASSRKLAKEYYVSASTISKHVNGSRPRKYTHLTNEQKNTLINRSNSGERVKDLIKIYNISNTTFYSSKAGYPWKM